MATLPWRAARSNSFTNAWFVKTLVKPSTIPAAGMGRFAGEPIGKGTVLFHYEKAKASEVSVSKENLFKKRTCFTFSNEQDIYRLMFAFYEHCDERPKFEELQEELAAFLAAWDNQLVLFNPSLCTNFALGDMVNVTGVQREKTFEFHATRDIVTGEEMWLDYHQEFAFPDFYYTFCSNWGIKPIPEFVDEYLQSRQLKENEQ